MAADLFTSKFALVCLAASAAISILIAWLYEKIYWHKRCRRCGSRNIVRYGGEMRSKDGSIINFIVHRHCDDCSFHETR